MKKVRQKTEDGTFIHAMHPLIDITLCMQALEGDFHKGKEEISVAKPVKKSKINCQNCITIINYCRDTSESL